jgi:hypothetical protein
MRSVSRASSSARTLRAMRSVRFPTISATARVALR